MMDEISKKNAAISLLRQLWSGYTSRNKEPERFTVGPERATYKLFRLLLALKRDVMLPKTRAWLEQGNEHGTDVVEVRLATLRYQRRVRLVRWQLDFFLDEMDARSYLDVRNLNVSH